MTLVARPVLLASILLAVGLCGCATEGAFTGLGIDDAWQVATDVLDRRGEITESDREAGRLRLAHSKYYPNDLLVEEQVGPRQDESFGRVSKVVEVELKETGAGAIRITVRGWIEYHAFARQFDKERDEAIETEVLDHLLADFEHERARQALERDLQRIRDANGSGAAEGMVLIPAGPFVRGSDDAFKNQQPARRIVLADYLIDTHEVTVGQYRKFMKDRGYRTRKHWSEAGWSWRVMFGISAPKSWRPDLRDSLPVIGVSWYEAEAFARWAGKQLPTEAQWEKAARFTLPTLYPWGNTWIDHVNCKTRAYYGPLPVEKFPGNVSLTGCFQMSGNAAEWCRDWYADEAYGNGPASDPVGPAAGTKRVLRGGSFYSRPDEVTTTHRDRADPGEQAVTYGFHCVRELSAGR